MSVTTLNLELGSRSYPIHIGQGLLCDRAFFKKNLEQLLPSKRVVVVSNTTVGPIYSNKLIAALEGFEVAQIELPDGERYKTLGTLSDIIDQLMDVSCDRDTALLALGGGVVGDISGFAAACFQRGIPYVQIPTTLLAQVDSAVGGKTAVNHPGGKNMIGAFYQPRAVFIDTDTLNTLADREFRAGLAEVIKYGLIRDGEFFAWLEENMDAILRRDSASLAYVIVHSCRNKAEVVAADETERGERALLNLGHTFGHAIEAATGYSDWLHGEAVAIGCVMALAMSVQCGYLGEDKLKRVTALFKRAGLRTDPPAGLTSDIYLEFMARDKKVSQGNIRLVLMRDIGDAFLESNYDRRDLKRALDQFCV